MDSPVTLTTCTTSPAQDPPLACTQAFRSLSFHPGWSSCQDGEACKELYGGSDFISFSTSLNRQLLLAQNQPIWEVNFLVL